VIEALHRADTGAYGIDEIKFLEQNGEVKSLQILQVSFVICSVR